MRASRPGLLVYANAGLFCDGYILSSVGLALIALQPHFRLDATATGWVGAATLLGILAGAPVFGHLTDRLGRRILMIADLSVFVVACVAQAFVTGVWQLVALRFVLGVAIGADYPIAAALIGESVPAAWRGAALNGMQVAWFLGAAAAYVVGYGLLRLGPDAWRWILASPAIFAAAGLLLRASAPESPMWQALQSGDAPRVALQALFSGRFLRPLAFVSAMWLLQVVPLFAIYAFAPAVLSALGLGARESPIGSLAITLAFLAGSLLSLPLVERWGRRPLCIAGFAIATIAFALLLAMRAPGVVVGCFIAYALAIGAAAGLELTYPVELFPTSIRASATGFAAAVSRVGAFAGTFALPLLLARYGIPWIVAGALALSALGWAIAQLWAPETRGIALE